ncbi:guanitoxin biosynthesis L-enduracididine beta-hydroxylase GntD [Streptosporangium sp. NPDC006013]|uniref:guanitoxin biosynthesis L-enduracididine beta-hydroxylase GntD n=1 Tax=Streptosporangium sp. NPDC006013 TaxID=3155596 RepID=UPI0033B8EE36
MLALHLLDDDVMVIEEIVRDLSQRYQTVESADFQRESRTYAEELPRRLRRALNEFRLAEPSGILLISGLPVDDARIGPTPADWKNKPVPSPTIGHDIAFFLIASLLGDPIGWATQQGGYIMHDVFPIKGYEHEQIGWSSEETLVWHTEDAFHPLRTDYLGLMCLRNPDKVETTYADVSDVRIDDDVKAILSQERFYILPDDSHRPANRAAVTGEDAKVADLRKRSYRQVDLALDTPEPVAVLFGDPDDPYIRIDPHYMGGIQEENAGKALAAFGTALDSAMTGVVLKPGDICLIDNYKAVHGRSPFSARFDGTDRWLRRLNVARDLRKSREFRLSASSRVIY